MHFTTPFLTLALSLTAFAQPTNHTVKASMSKLSSSPAFRVQGEDTGAATTCDVGSISCCNSVTETTNDGLLAGLLQEGILNGLAGNKGSSCARASLIDSLGLLGLTQKTDTGPVCKNIVACCPEGTKTCVAIDNSGVASQASGAPLLDLDL